MDMQQKLTALKQVSFSKFLPEDDLLFLLSSCKCLSLKAGELLYSDQLFKESMYIILDGTLEVYKRHKHIASRGVGEFFGEMSLLESQPRSANVRATTDSVLLEIDKNIFNNYIGSSPRIIWEISKTLSQRTREDIEMLESDNRDLKRTEEKLHRIVASVSDLVIQVNPSGIIEFVNEPIRTLGYGMKELIGKPFAEIYEGELDDERKRHIFTRRVGQRSLIEIEFVLKVNPCSSLHEIAQNISYQVSTLGLWNVPEEMVSEEDTEKEFLGSLLIAQPTKS